MAEIKISELSIRDCVKWKVYDKTYVIRITQITDTIIRGVHDGIEYGVLLKQISPIPLTPEILEKNGWKFDKTSRWYVYDVAHDTCVNVWLGKKEQSRIEVSVRSGSFDFYYNHADFAVVKPCVHQLQHALRLAGVEKEIEV